MTWEAISIIAEIVGAAAVVVTLIYLAVQVRQNTASVTTSTYDSVISGFNATNSIVIDNPEVAAIFLRGNQDPVSLSDTEGVQYAFLLRSWSNQWLKLLRLHQEGALSTRDWTRFALEAAQAFDTPGGRIFRQENHVFEDLYAEVDRIQGDRISEIKLGGSQG